MRLLFYWLHYTTTVFPLPWRGGIWLPGKDARSVSHSFLAISTRRRLVICRGTLESVAAWRGDSWCAVSVSTTFGSSSDGASWWGSRGPGCAVRIKRNTTSFMFRYSHWTWWRILATA